MLQLTIPEIECYDEENNEFIKIPEQILQLEHSLISISKWESKWHIPFLTKDKKTLEQTIDYIRCMTINKRVDPRIYDVLPPESLSEINEYIENPMTATWFNDGDNNDRSREIITSEILYYQMLKTGIPFECERWHINRLITLIRVYSEKEAPKKKMSPNEIRMRNAELNAKRRAQMKSKG